MRRLLLALVALALVAVALSACNASFTPYAARVGGVTVAQSTLDAALDSVTTDPGYRCVIESDAGGAAKVAGAGTDTYSSSFASSALSLLIEAQAVKVAVANMHLHPGAFADAVAKSQLPANFSPPSGSSCTASGTAVFDGLSPSYRATLIGLEADEDVLAAHSVGVTLTPSGIAAYARHHLAATTLDCTSAIEVASKIKASQLADAIRGGVSFITVAKKNSIDASAPKGGSLGCIAPSRLISPLGSVVSHLRVGALSAPVAFQKDWLLLEVTKREKASTASVASGTVIPAGSTAANDDLTSFDSHASVSIDPTYGTWKKSKSGFAVVPPSGPPLDLVPNPAAVGATTSSIG